MIRQLMFLLAALLLLAPSSAANDVIKKIEARFEPASAKPGEVVTWKLTLTLADRWHTYPTKQIDSNSGNVTKITFQTPPGLKPIEEVIDPESGITLDNPDSGPPLFALEGTITWQRKFEVSNDAKDGDLQLLTNVRIQFCDDRHCLPWDKFESTATLRVGNGNAAPDVPAAVVPAPSPPEVPADSAAYKRSLEEILKQLDRNQAAPTTDLLPFLLTAMFWGGLTLLTPCVFPMIPITVSFFLKQSEKQGSPLLLACVYCGTIILVLGIASLTLLGFFTALAINPWMNAFLGILFVILALSLFGMFDLTLPASLTRFTSSREGQGGLIGTVFMALTFTIVSFTCVAPFLGGFGGMAAQGQFRTWELVLGALAFSATFAFPFFLLALFPALIRKLPKSGSWLHTVKVVMAFIEIAAALKFFRTAELIKFREPVFFTYDLVLGMWVALSLLCGLYLLRVVRIGHNELEEGNEVSVPRFLVGFAFVSLGFYLLPALFGGGADGGNHRPRGAVFAWVDSFLLPDPTETTEQWTGDLAKALENARNERRRTNKPAYVFVDFTGETCTNCKLNERTIFTRPQIKEQFANFQLVQLFTDKVPEKYYPPAVRAKLVGTERQIADADVNRWFQDQAFETQQLPLYVILEPKLDGRVSSISYDEGKINNPDAFLAFLRDRKVQ